MASKFKAANTLSDLAKALQKETYTPRTEEERRTLAENFYKNAYDQAMLSAQQKYDESNTALQSQLASLETSTNRQLDAQREANAQAYSRADRTALSRGMQRSSYNLQNLANVDLKGNEALQQINQNRADTENSIAAQQTLLARQLAENKAAADSTYQNNILSYMQQLADQDYQRSTAATQNNNAIQLKLYEKKGTTSSGTSKTYSKNTNSGGNNTNSGGNNTDSAGGDVDSGRDYSDRGSIWAGLNGVNKNNTTQASSTTKTGSIPNVTLNLPKALSNASNTVKKKNK